MRKVKFNLGKALHPYTYILPALITFGIVAFYPLINGMIMSFTDYTLYNQKYDWNGFQNYINLFKDNIFWEVVFNSFFIVFLSVFISLMMGLVLAIFFNIKFPMRGFYRSTILIIWVIPMIVISLLWLVIYNQDYGLINDILFKLGIVDNNIPWLGSVWLAKFAIIIIYGWRGTPFFMVMILAALQIIPEDIIEASRIDGANNFRRFIYIIIPYIKNILLLTSILSMVRLFQDVTLILILTGGGPINSTTTLSVHVYKTAFQNLNLSTAAAIGIIWFLLLLVFIVFYITNLMKKENN